MDPIKSFMVPSEKFITVERDMDVQTAARLMRDRRISSLFVTKGKEIVGILTDTDMVRRVVATGVDTLTTTAEKIMSAPILTIEEDKTVLDASDLMAQKRIRHLGVTQGGKLVGMISVRDILVFLTNLRGKEKVEEKGVRNHYLN
jgi:CBS domain-containing protein